LPERFGSLDVRPKAEPYRRVECAPPFGDGAMVVLVGDPEAPQQIAHVSAAAGSRSSRLRGLLVIEPDARAPLGRGDHLFADGMSPRPDRRRDRRVVHFQKRIARVEQYGAHRHARNFACLPRAVKGVSDAVVVNPEPAQWSRRSRSASALRSATN
jgi:hypothetical protein